MSFCDWLISLSIVSFRFIYVVMYDRIFFFLWLNHIPLHASTTFVYSFINGHLGCSHILAFIHNAAMNIHVQVDILKNCPTGDETSLMWVLDKMLSWTTQCSRVLWAELCLLPNPHVEVLTPSTSECDCT